MSFVITGFLHYKWQLTAPLFIQCVMNPKNLVSSPLFSIFVLGKTVHRPFPEPPSPFAALLNPEAAQQSGRPNIVEVPTEDKPSGAADTPKGLKKKKSKKAD